MRRILVAFMSAVCATVASSAYAVDCDARISDGAGLLRGSLVSVSAQQLADAGADVRVVTVSSLEGQGNLDNLFRAYLTRCRSWQAGGGIKNNLVVLMLSVGERRSIGLYFDKSGPFLTLESHWLRIQGGVKPFLKRDEFERGLSVALDDIRRVTTAAQAPVQDRVALQPVSEKPQVVVQTTPTDFSGLWRVLAWVAGTGFGFWFIILGGRAFGKSRDRRERQRSAQLRARSAKASCAAGIVDFDSLAENVGAQVALAQSLLLAEDVGDLPAQLKKAEGIIRAATLEYSEVDHGLYDPERPNLSETEYVRIAEYFEAVNAKLRAARETANACKRAAERKRTLPEEAAAVEVAAHEACRKATEAVADAKSAGYITVFPEGTIAIATKTVEVAQSTRKARRYTTAIEASKQAVAYANEAAAWCVGLPERTQKLTAAIGTASTRTTAVAGAIGAAKEVFDILAAEYNRSSYDSIHGNGTAAAVEVGAATEALATATIAMSERQAWDEAEGLVSEANKALDRADSLIHAIHNRKQHLEKVKADAKAEVDAAATDIAAAREYIKTNKGDVTTGHTAALDRADAQLEEARSKLKVRWPDWPQIAKLAKAANEAADAVLAKARSEYEAAERERQQAATNLREAKRARAKLREYQQNHSSTVSSGVRRRLDDIDRRLSDAESSSDLAYIIAMTNSISTDANSAYKTARSEVAAATPVYTPSSSYHSSDSSIGGGSSSFDFGGGGGGGIGGGSSDF